MRAERHIAWERLNALIAKGLPLRLGLDGSPPLELMVESAGRRVGLLVPMATTETIPKTAFEYVDLAKRNIDGKSFLYLSTSSERLFQEFYAFLTGVADSIQLEHKDPVEAIAERLDSWKLLFARLKRLSPEEETGLIGELWFLRELLRSGKSFDAWTGPAGEPHDFRIDSSELEIKTTRHIRRLHTIHGLSQLLPSPEMSLSVVSIQLEPAGAAASGFSLPMLIEQIRTELQGMPFEADRFRAMLSSSFGYSDTDSHLYTERFTFRTRPRVIPVDQFFPRLVRSQIDSLVGNAVAARILTVIYEVDLEGLGDELSIPAGSSLGSPSKE